jgi:MFS family permease
MFPLAQFFGAPINGEFSDRYGRKKAFIITILGTCLGHVMTGLSIFVSYLPLLFIGRIWTGFFAGNQAICLAALADLSPDEHVRSKNFGMLGGIGGIGFLLAIACGSLLSDSNLNPFFNPGLPFWLIAFLSLLNLGILFQFYQESHPTHPHTPWRLLSGIKHLSHVLKIKDLRWTYLIYFCFILCWVTSAQFLPTILIREYFVRTSHIAWVFLGIGTIWALANFLINRWASVRYGAPKILKPSLFILSGLLFLTLIPSNLGLFLTFFYLCVLCAALNWTNCLAVVSMSASQTIQGSVMGINQSIGSIAAIAGPLIGGFIGVINTHYIYLFTGMASLVAGLLLNWHQKRKIHEEPQ